MERWSVGHSREGFKLYLYRSPLWSVIVSRVFGNLCFGRFHPCVLPVIHRPWNWLICAEDHMGKASDPIPITPGQAYELEPFNAEWFDEIMNDPDHLPDGSLRKELWQ